MNLMRPFRVLFPFLALSLPATATLPRPTAAAFDKGATITVSGYTGSAPLSGFPVLVRISAGSPAGFAYSDLHSSSDGADLAFIAEDIAAGHSGDDEPDHGDRLSGVGIHFSLVPVHAPGISGKQLDHVVALHSEGIPVKRAEIERRLSQPDLFPSLACAFPFPARHRCLFMKIYGHLRIPHSAVVLLLDILQKNGTNVFHLC